MTSESRYSFINGLIAGAGIVLSIMSIALLKLTAPLEGKMGFTTIEIRVAIFIGFLVFIISLLHEMYRKKTRINKSENEFKTKIGSKD